VTLDHKARRQAPSNPRLAAIWEATPTCNRYWINDAHHVLTPHGLKTLADLTPAEIAALEPRQVGA
jgi:hypothetical protein